MLLHSKLYFVFCLIKFYKVNKKIKNIRFNDFLRYIVFICKMLYCYKLKEFKTFSINNFNVNFFHSLVSDIDKNHL